MTHMTENGVSTTCAGEEQFEECVIGKSKCVQYDYRTSEGKLFSCVKKSLDACRSARDEWLETLST